MNMIAYDFYVNENDRYATEMGKGVKISYFLYFEEMVTDRRANGRSNKHSYKDARTDVSNLTPSHRF